MHIERIRISFYLLCLALSFCGCSQDELVSPDSPGNNGHELAEGERCNVTLSITGMPSIEQATTRAIPEGKNTVLMDFTNHELKSREGKEAGWISTEVRTEFGEEERAATRAIPADKMFQKNSKFRMLVFKGSSSGNVNMNTPVANMVCQVNNTGTAATFLSPSTTLGLLKGWYTFICFPADEKYNTWQVGEDKDDNSIVPVSNDEDFVYCKLENIEMSNSTKQLRLSFARKCYQLTVKLVVAEELGYIIGVDTVPITVGNSSGATFPIVSSATFDLVAGTMSGHQNKSIESRIPVLSKDVIPQSFGSVDNMLIAPASSTPSQLTIGYPQITVFKPAGTNDSKSDSIFTIKAGSVITKDPFTFEANKSYTITLSIGEQPKGIMVGGVIWAKGNLVYSTNNKYEQAPTPDKARHAREVRGDWFRWLYTLPQSSNNQLSTNAFTGQSWKPTCPTWSGKANDLGNLSYYKSYGPKAIMTAPTDKPTAAENGDPCRGLGGKWRMPTYNEISLLCYVASSDNPGGTLSTPRSHFKNIAKTAYSATWNDSNFTGDEKWYGIYITGGSKPNVNSVAITDKNQYKAGVHLFLPAAGYSVGANINNAGTYGLYWSSTPYSGSTAGSWYAFFYSGSLDPGNLNRDYGFSVRCVLGD